MRSTHRTGLLADRAGSALVEFAFVVPVLMLLSVGSLEAGRLFVEHLRITAAANAGIQHGMQYIGAVDDKVEAIREAAKAGAGSASAGYVVDPDIFHTCADGTLTDLGTGCPEGSDLRTYLQVSVSGTVQLLFDLPALPRGVTLSSTRVQRLN